MGKKLSFEEVEKLFSFKGYELLETEYIDTFTHMKFRCSKHNSYIQSTTVDNLKAKIKKGNGTCKECGREMFNRKTRGKNHHNWKGTKEINKYLRSIFSGLREKVLQQHEYKCFITNEISNTLDIHHIKPLNVIRDEILNELKIPLKENISDYSKCELNLIKEKVINKHTENMLIPLKKEVHILYHNLVGREGEKINEFTFNIFKQKYQEKGNKLTVWDL